RAHLRCFVCWITDPDAPRRLDQGAQKFVVDGSLDEDARARAAVLAGVVEDGIRRRGRGTLEVRVREDDVRRLSAELEGDALDRSGRALHHAPSDLGRAGEGDLRDLRMVDQAPADD